MSFMDNNDRRSLLSLTADSTLSLCQESPSLCCCAGVRVLQMIKPSPFCWDQHEFLPHWIVFSQTAFLIPDDWMNWLYGFFSPLLFLLVWSHDTVILIFRVVRGAGTMQHSEFWMLIDTQSPGRDKFKSLGDRKSCFLEGLWSCDEIGSD